MNRENFTQIPFIKLETLDAYDGSFNFKMTPSVECLEFNFGIGQA